MGTFGVRLNPHRILYLESPHSSLPPGCKLITLKLEKPVLDQNEVGLQQELQLAGVPPLGYYMQSHYTSAALSL